MSGPSALQVVAALAVTVGIILAALWVVRGLMLGDWSVRTLRKAGAPYRAAGAPERGAVSPVARLPGNRQVVRLEHGGVRLLLLLSPGGDKVLAELPRDPGNAA